MITRKSILRTVLCSAILLGIASLAWSEGRDDETTRLKAAGDVLNEIMAAPDKAIPQDLLESAVCIGVAPSLKKGGFIFGAEYGKGVATCRPATGWSAPAPFKVVGGSWGLQVGAEAADLVMLIMNKDGMEKLLSSKFKLGPLRRVLWAAMPRVKRIGR